MSTPPPESLPPQILHYNSAPAAPRTHPWLRRFNLVISFACLAIPLLVFNFESLELDRSYLASLSVLIFALLYVALRAFLESSRRSRPVRMITCPVLALLGFYFLVHYIAYRGLLWDGVLTAQDEYRLRRKASLIIVVASLPLALWRHRAHSPRLYP